MTNKSLTIGLIVVAIIAIGGYFFPQVKGAFGNVITSTDITATRYTQLLVDNGIMVSAGGANITGGMVNDGITRTYNRVAVSQATTTLCSIKSPAATTTLARATVNLTTTASYAFQLELANDPSAFATTTAIVAKWTTTASSPATIVATSSVTALADGIVPPSTFINVNVSTSSGGTSATFAPVGFCQAEFVSVI